jgi:glycosyltransferase involved in cell wall biosynthesis
VIAPYDPEATLGRPGMRVAFIGNALPRRCGIATFTTDLQGQVAAARANIETCIVAMNDGAQTYAYPPEVEFQIRDDDPDDYLKAATFLNGGSVDLVCLQHEFGIFGGEAGANILALLTRLRIPVVTTFHTVLSEPTPAQRQVIDQIATLSAEIVVMAQKGRELLEAVYGIEPEKISVIPHGIPDFEFVEPDQMKSELGFSGRPVILTFGLLAPSKGIDLMIEAMPSILAACPKALYIVLGATHPNLLRSQGEEHRERLQARVRELGIEGSVVFLNQFVDQPTLLRYISICDVYVTPYLHESQMTSGTLAYSYGLGRAVVSTPYWHALELLGEGRGVLVPFGDVPVMAAEISGLLTDHDRRSRLQRGAYDSSRGMTWARTAQRYLSLFDQVPRAKQLSALVLHPRRPSAFIPTVRPAVRLEHFHSMCDDTGLFQHALHSVPDRSHGYCIDDNARALLLASTLSEGGDETLSQALTTRFAAFLQHGWNPATRSFRNFMSFERCWLEESGSEDSNGRTLWALGKCAGSDTNSSRQQWAQSLFVEALPIAEDFRSPRAWAFTLLGLDPYCARFPEDVSANRLRHKLASRLVAIFEAASSPGWVWFEDVLAYDNARLSQALILTGRSTLTRGYSEAGLKSLRWLVSLQTSPEGMFRPVGSDSFGQHRKPPRPFDQQPLEATATIAACLAAYDVEDDDFWRAAADIAFQWFHGRNDLATPLVDVATGACRDGLHPDRANENRGGESVVSYLLSVAELRNADRQARSNTIQEPLRA